MAVINLNYLKTFFETYDKPTEEQFADLIDTLSTILDIISYNVAGIGDVWTAVNFSTKIEHEQKQLNVVYHNGKTYLFNAPLGTYGYGGIPTTESNYVDLVSSQFSESEVDAIIELITKDVTVETSINVTEFEQGVYTTINYIADIQHEDVTVTSIKLNGAPKQAGLNNTQVTANENITISKSYTLVIDYVRLGVTMQKTYIDTVVAYIPQYAGSSLITDYDGKNVSTITLPKYIKSTSELSYESILSNSYVWFILNDKNVSVHDQNGLKFRDGDWASDEYFIKKIGTIVLSNGSIASVAFYRSKTILNTNGNDFEFKSE